HSRTRYRLDVDTISAAKYAAAPSQSFTVPNCERRILVSDSNALDQLVREYQEKRLTRREVLTRAASLGLSVSAVAALLAGARPAQAAGNDGSTAKAARRQEPKVGGILREGY